MPERDVYAIRSDEDIPVVRMTVREWAAAMGFSLVDQTKLVTVASELARNVVLYAGSGVLRLEQIHNGARKGLRMVFEDHGPGIEDVEQAMMDGHTTSGGLGLGLSGSARICDHFDIVSVPGEGTTVTAVKWK